MPHIELPEGLPGITGLLEYRRDSAAPIREITQILLRGHSSLSEGERELIAALVSHRNECRFCSTAHAAAADLLLGEHDTCDAVKADLTSAPLGEKMKALLSIAAKVQQSGRLVTTEDIAAARDAGATDMEIHDSVLIAALFCFYNRYVDGLATWTPDNSEFYETLAQRIVHRGYRRPEEGYADLKTKPSE